MILEEVRCFDDLCTLGLLYVLDRTNRSLCHPANVMQNYNTNLYEFIGDKEWIKHFIVSMNKNKFVTINSQPGESKVYTPMRSKYDRAYNTQKILNHKKIYKIEQRAWVNGFMTRRHAIHLRRMLSLYPDIVILISGDIPMPDDQYVSATSIDGEFQGVSTIRHLNQMRIRGKLPIDDPDYLFIDDVKKMTPDHVLTYSYPPDINYFRESLPNLNPMYFDPVSLDGLVGVSIFNKKFNDNIDFWGIVARRVRMSNLA